MRMRRSQPGSECMCRTLAMTARSLGLLCVRSSEYLYDQGGTVWKLEDMWRLPPPSPGGIATSFRNGFESRFAEVSRKFCQFRQVRGRISLWILRIIQGWVISSVTFLPISHATTSLYRSYTSSCIDKNTVSRTTRDSRRTPSTVMLQQTPRTSDIDNGEWSHPSCQTRG